MRYMLLIFLDEQAEAQQSEEERKAMFDRCKIHASEMKQSGVLRATSPLQPTSTAKTVRLQDGRTLATDGPFAETKEQLGGFSVVDCEDLDRALRLAEEVSRIHNNASGAVEVRPLLEIGPAEA